MPIFVVQKHAATHLHYDFRLEINRVLKSWAVPKEPPKVKGIKRLAIPVPDHPLSYAKFEGIIPDGYGKGTVKIWDRGNYKMLEKKKDRLVFELGGKKLRGNYCLIKFKEKSWLLFKIQ